LYDFPFSFQTYPNFTIAYPESSNKSSVFPQVELKQETFEFLIHLHFLAKKAENSDDILKLTVFMCYYQQKIT
jgi:hypothetical protein